MSEMEELRSELTRRGVKHLALGDMTSWRDADGHRWVASEASGGLLRVSTSGDKSHLTHTQAITMTLGRMTCHIVYSPEETENIAYSPEDTWAYECDGCGWEFRYDRGIKPKYCPNCGRKAEEE